MGVVRPVELYAPLKDRKKWHSVSKQGRRRLVWRNPSIELRKQGIASDGFLDLAQSSASAGRRDGMLRLHTMFVDDNYICNGYRIHAKSEWTLETLEMALLARTSNISQTPRSKTLANR